MLRGVGLKTARRTGLGWPMGAKFGHAWVSRCGVLRGRPMRSPLSRLSQKAMTAQASGEREAMARLEHHELAQRPDQSVEPVGRLPARVSGRRGQGHLLLQLPENAGVADLALLVESGDRL